MPILEVDSLTVDLDGEAGRRRILDDVSISLEAGEPMGLVGESGSGKSMTLRSILGMLPPGASVVGGEIRFDGRNILTSGPGGQFDQRIRGTGISMVFQEPAIALNPVMKVGRQITDAIAERRGLSKKEAHDLAVELMNRVGITDPDRRARHYPFQFSGGMRQRVMIAAALAQEPQILLCDEPTTALDVTIQAQVLDLFRTMQQDEGLGLLYVTHDLAVVAQLCSSISVMKDGQIVEHGVLQEVFDDPREEYTRRLLTATPRIDEDVDDSGLAEETR
ncbi:peptide/nickel transport system ATP-binding protein [Brevibacterium siliguriense]|uniref:Peptide/nickel transport system ATP-binding protein n=1 Tax=Brevibacterium siliguriense TaxID=1136497 RepID=A0A1H1N3C9_9MICO|nr:ABC transporter ATP-binding protein [Brevibacterium siliguriense]SDR93486.1 peptide/nickel transport system ATP-binding protein [Brevibacterium siliguriense]